MVSNNSPAWQSLSRGRWARSRSAVNGREATAALRCSPTLRAQDRAERDAEREAQMQADARAKRAMRMEALAALQQQLLAALQPQLAQRVSEPTEDAIVEALVNDPALFEAIRAEWGHLEPGSFMFVSDASGALLAEDATLQVVVDAEKEFTRMVVLIFKAMRIAGVKRRAMHLDTALPPATEPERKRRF